MELHGPTKEQTVIFRTMLTGDATRHRAAAAGTVECQVAQRCAVEALAAKLD